MPRYFFNIRDGYDIDDDTGTEFPDIYAAQSEAIRFSGEVLREMGGRFWNATEWILEVADETGRVLFALQFSGEERGMAPDRDPESKVR